jgi:hypothetical protein
MIVCRILENDGAVVPKTTFQWKPKAEKSITFLKLPPKSRNAKTE